MRRRHAISPGFYGHYQDLGIWSKNRHDAWNRGWVPPRLGWTKNSWDGVTHFDGGTKESSELQGSYLGLG